MDIATGQPMDKLGVVEKKRVAMVTVLHNEVLTLVDTRSMISIVLVDILEIYRKMDAT